MNKLNHFTDQEVAGLDQEFCAMLDMAAGILHSDAITDDPRVILTFTTGGQHCQHSTHYKGLAVDIGLGHLAEGFIRDKYRLALVKALIDAGFRRIEDCPLHVHVDHGQAPDYATPALILGQDA